MSDENLKGIVGEVAGAVEGIVKAVPVYQDAAQPAAQEFGRTIQPAGHELGEAVVTVAKVVNLSLLPLRAVIWSYETIQDFIETKVQQKLKDTPLDEIQTPDLTVAGPAVESLRFTGHNPDLAEMYASLLAASMDVKTASIAHPAFVEIIKQLTSDEAKLMRYFSRPNILLPLISVDTKHSKLKGSSNELRFFSLFGSEAGCNHPQLIPQYLDNLSRLGLIAIPLGVHYTNESVYGPLTQHPNILALCERVNATEKREAKIVKHVIQITDLGKQFIAACLTEHAAVRNAISQP